MERENNLTKKLFERGEKSRRTRPELAAPASVTKWKPTERMKEEWRRKPYK